MVCRHKVIHHGGHSIYVLDSRGVEGQLSTPGACDNHTCIAYVHSFIRASLWAYISNSKKQKALHGQLKFWHTCHVPFGVAK